MSMLWGYIQFEIVKTKNAKSLQVLVSGERYRSVGPLGFICSSFLQIFLLKCKKVIYSKFEI